MSDERVIYLHTINKNPRLMIKRIWNFGSDEEYEQGNEYRNITISSWLRVNNLFHKARQTCHQTMFGRVWIAFWFGEKIL